MSSYPAYKINTVDEQLNVLQITDLHLSTYGSKDSSIDDDSESQRSCQLSFEAVLKQALNEDRRCDLILVTGDLVSRVQPAIYDYIFSVLTATQIPFVCIAGNHDVTDEVDEHLPFEQRQLVARSADPRLLNQHVIDTEHWQLLLLDSAIPGKVAGALTTDNINWLCAQLNSCHKPALLALHHHVLPMQSEWIDAHIATNTDIFWQSIAPFSHLHVIVNGHTHQEHVHHHNGVTVYTTPSTCHQYQPYEDDFAYDVNAHPGYRWLQLANNGQVASWVKRLDT